MISRRALATVGVAALLGMAATTGAASASGSSVLDLELGEAPGATTTVDSSGMGHDGTVGSRVTVSSGFAQFQYHSPSEGVYYGADQLITVPDAKDGSLDPGAGDFSVEIRYRTTHPFGNIIQKGQATSVGGQVKLQQPKGKISCMFKTPTGTATASSGTRLLNDGAWHVVHCDRTPTSVTMYVDGVRTMRVNHDTGTLDNTKPWTLGGKLDCNTAAGSGADSCDYFAGDLDYVRITKGDTATTPPPSDTTAPSVATTSPAAEATGASRTGNITATFSEPVTGVDATTMVLRRTSTGSKFGGVVTYDAAAQTATLDPNVTLPSNTRFTVTVGSGVADTAGNPLAPTAWSFTTGS
jgi:Bacterial Ig-like domain/Laminin G domain